MKVFKWSSSALLTLMVIAFFSACEKQNVLPGSDAFEAKSKFTKTEITQLSTPVQLLTDQNFQRGFKVLHPSTGAVQGNLQYTSANGAPVWNLAQWYSAASIYGATPSTLASGSYQYANSYKAITVGPTTSSDGHIIFAINGQSEFGGVYRTATAPFPHLLADLKIADPDGWLGTATPFIGAMDSLNFNIDTKLIYHARNQTTGYNPAIHAVQFSCTFLIQNLNPSNAGYGKAMYFLIMIYDDRYATPGPSVTTDMFSGQMIYNVGITPFSSTGLTVGQWKNISGNILPMIKNGLNQAWSQGILTDSQNYNDYKVSLFTMGLECPGLNIATIQAKNLSLIAK